MPFGQPSKLLRAGQWLTLGSNGLVPNLIRRQFGHRWGTPARRITCNTPVSRRSLISPRDSSPPLSYNSMGLYQAADGGNWLSQNTYMLANIPGVIDEPAEVIADRRYLQSSDQVYHSR